MSYKRLHYEQYFIDTSEDYNNTGRARAKIEYKAVEYRCDRKKHPIEALFGVTHEVNYAFWYDSARDVIQIHFQGTAGGSDWFANIIESANRYYDAFPYGDEMITLRVHHGWGDMYKTIKHDIREEWKALSEAHPDAQTEVIGWSLGSAQAMLCCQDLNYNFGVRPYLYTYGSVRPFRALKNSEKKLLADYLDSICTRCFNFANRNDIVTYMPPFPGYRMIDRKNIGEKKVKITKLIRPFTYHMSYDQEELYRRKQ